METIKYFCDVCKEEFEKPPDSYYWTKENSLTKVFIQIGHSTYSRASLDICQNCIEKTGIKLDIQNTSKSTKVEVDQVKDKFIEIMELLGVAFQEDLPNQ